MHIQPANDMFVFASISDCCQIEGLAQQCGISEKQVQVFILFEKYFSMVLI